MIPLPADMATFIETLGPSRRMWVDWRPDAIPTFPPVCPCCLDRPTRGVSLRVEGRESKARFDFPACATCARHVSLGKRISSALGTAVFGASVATMAAVLVAMGGWAGLLEPFRNPIRGVLTLLIGLVLMVVWAFVLRWLVVWPIETVLRLNKPTCAWFESPVKWGAFDKPLALRRGLGFENLEYARRFCRANGIE